MNPPANQPRRARTRHAILLLAILLGGFALRVHVLGRDGLRLDEAGQALAAIQPTLGGMIAIEKTHAAAMPLDYLGTRLAAAVGLQEFILRFPSAVWGTLAIALIYALARRLSLSRGASLVAAFFLALSPIHVYYAQELRFYASLQAFTLLSTLALIAAWQRPTWPRWLAFAAVTLVGAAFHPYVLLTLVTGGVYLALSWLWQPSADRRARRGFVVAGIAVVLGFLPLYLLLATSTSYAFDPLQWTGTWGRFFIGGLDWTNRLNTPPSTLTTVWAALNLVLILLGLAAVLRQRARYLWLLSLVLSLVASTLLIVATTLLESYWLIPRQLVHLSPTLMILAAVGVGWVARAVGTSRRGVLRLAVVLGLLVFVAVAAGGQLQGYYAAPRATGREVARSLMASHTGTEPIFVVPPNEAQAYLFYMTAAGRADLTQYMLPSSLDQLPGQLSAVVGRVHLALASNLDDAQTAALQALGLARVVPPGPDLPSRYQHYIRDQGVTLP